MQSFDGKIAVVTGGGSGMGRELVVQLASAGCSVATCDVNADSLEETADAARGGASSGARVTTHTCDVSDEAQVLAFRDGVVSELQTDHVNLLFNNAGIGGGGSFVAGSREEWERTFGICWSGVYLCCRAFVPLVVRSGEGYIVNTSSVNGFLAKLGNNPHTAYSAAKFAVKGFSEALITDLAVNAPHVRVAVVMPGHIGTNIVRNTSRVLGREALAGADETQIEAFNAGFRDRAPLTPAQAATIILDGVRSGKWRILVGEDAHRADEQMRRDPESVYGPNGSPAAATTTGAAVSR